jgi:hypothetical protein
LDEQIEKLAVAKEMTYTRYSDDIFISSGDDNFTKLHALRLVRQVRKIVNEFGMTINKNKTRIYAPNSSFQYLGLLVGDERVRLPRHYRNQLDKTEYMLGRIGLQQAEIEYSRNNLLTIAHAQKTANRAHFFLTRYIGQLMYVRQVEPGLATTYARSLNTHILGDPTTWAAYYDDYTRISVTSALKILLS